MKWELYNEVMTTDNETDTETVRGIVLVDDDAYETDERM